jgi:hypothetical protein
MVALLTLSKILQGGEVCRPTGIHTRDEISESTPCDIAVLEGAVLLLPVLDFS